MSFRKLLFWIHLSAGVLTGVVIGIMSLTGAALAFEKELLAWSERDVRRIAEPGEPFSLIPVEDLLDRVRRHDPNGSPSAIVVLADPKQAIQVIYSRTNTYFVNPYTGEIRETNAPRTRAFLQTMLNWHRWLGREGESRDSGKAITGASNLVFLGLAFSGIYLWWPKSWTPKQLRAVAVPSFRGRGRARDWNWHNAFGVWSAPVLIVLTLTALPISYRWAGDLIYTLTGTPKPAGSAMSGLGSPPAPAVSAPPGQATPLGYSALLARVAEQAPNWEQMTLRLGSTPARGSGRSESRPPATAKSQSERPASTSTSAEKSASTAPVSIAVKERDVGPRFASRLFSVDPFTGSILRQESFADLDRARQVRSWTRFLHTGEALGPIGQAVAGLASAVAGILVWTGLALTWRRFFSRRTTAEPEKAFG